MTITLNDGYLSIKAGEAEMSVAQATSLFEEALADHQVNSVLLHGCVEKGEPYYGSVANWVEALGAIESQSAKKIIIDTPSQPQNRQSSILVGDLSPVLKAHSILEELIVSGQFKLSTFSHPTLEKAEFTKRSLSIADVESIASYNCPKLRRLGLNACEDGMPEGFSQCLVSTLSANAQFNLDELYVFYSDEGQDLIRGLCESNLVDKLELIDLMDRELGYDPDDTMALLLKHAGKIAKLKTLRIPFNGLMEEEVMQLGAAIPSIVNSCPVDGEPLNVPWHRPFSPQH